MSAVAVWEDLPAAGGRGSRAGRPQLRLLPGGAAEVVAQPRHARLTRAGRLAVTTVLVVLALLVASAAVGARGAASGASRTVTVQAGQTLSEIARAELPELSVADGVARLQLANGLSSPHVRAGQQLVVPTSR
ncbi:MAG TPA: LysM peptidoglycan-binding domain-containing protein [Dermatophilaceae bacterium]|nr:LysM peptidoglycan-binding domain-containing protein [Dermatophilaceae bacterium]